MASIDSDRSRYAAAMTDASDVAVVAALDDEQRRAVYALLRRRRAPMTRDEVAADLGISRNLAAFHLDKLLDIGLVAASYSRPEGRGGPGAGRPAKRYELSDLEVEVSVPPRRYDLAGEILAEAVATAGPRESARAAAERVARRRGRETGERYRKERRLRRLGPERSLAAAADVLGGLGFEPAASPEDRHTLLLRNCPFHAVVNVATELVCGLNQAFMAGVLEGLGASKVVPVLDPADGRCCVLLNAR
jgi:predicted ArsR family transcriptional regulator